MLRSALVRGATPTEALEAANAAVTNDNQIGMFATAFVAVLELRTGRLRHSCAGHNPPYLLRRDSTLAALDQAGGIALGVIEPFEFIAAEITLAQEDALFLFTDGVTEAYDPAQLLYGEARLEFLSAHGARDAEAMIRQVSSEKQAFVRDQEQADDMTMLSVVYLGRSRDGHAQAA